jgi:hypothetical protein
MRIVKNALLAALGLVLILPVFAGDLPSRGMTPGGTHPRITQANIQQTVCVTGYTKTVRPSVYYTNQLKRLQIMQYGYWDKNPQHYEEDHLIALSIGGHPTDARNLWPEPRDSKWGAEKKDQLESVLHRLVCRGEVQLATAQYEMATDWITAWKKYVPSHQSDLYGHVD